MNTKLKLLAAALPLTLLLGAALPPGATAAQIGGTGPVGPQPFEYWQGWYEYNTYGWQSGTPTNPGSFQITTHHVVVGGTSENECNMNLHNGMITVKVTKWNTCYKL